MKRRDEIYEWICNYKRENQGTNPTVSEIAEEFTLTHAGATSHINWLIIDGKLEKHGRSFRVPLSEWELVS